MSNPNPFRPADILEAQNHAAEQTQRARKAVRAVLASAAYLLIAADELALVSRGAREACMPSFCEQARKVRDELAAAAELLDRADPLGDSDTSVEHEGMVFARSDYHAALCALGLDALSLAA